MMISQESRCNITEVWQAKLGNNVNTAQCYSILWATAPDGEETASHDGAGVGRPGGDLDLGPAEIKVPGKCPDLRWFIVRVAIPDDSAVRAYLQGLL